MYKQTLPVPLMVGAGGAGGISSSLVSISMGASPPSSLVDVVGPIIGGGGGAGGIVDSFIFIHC